MRGHSPSRIVESREGEAVLMWKPTRRKSGETKSEAQKCALKTVPRRSLGNVLVQLDEGIETRRAIEDYLAAVKDQLEYRN